MADSTPVIAISGLVKDYHGLRPLRIASLQVTPGARVAISGLDAAAAEVLVNLVNGATLPDQGEIRIFGRPTASITDERDWFALLDQFGVVTPRAVLLDLVTVRQNLALPFTIDFEDLGAEVIAKTDALAAEVELAAESLGQRAEGLPPLARMRIHLARALANGPQVLLLEHPTAILPREDSMPFGAIVERVARRRQLTVLAITEDAAFAERVATTRYRLQAGSGALVNAHGWRRWFG